MEQNAATVAAALLQAATFAARKHRDQRRKDEEASPYINHPIAVAEVLARIGQVDDIAVLQAALLHDTLEDTQTSSDELEQEFGSRVRTLVEEVTDDKTLPKEERKRLQVEHAPDLSPGAKLIKLADKICNVRDVAYAPPEGWNQCRRTEYVAWADDVVAGCKGTNQALEDHFAALVDIGAQRLVIRRVPREAPRASDLDCPGDIGHPGPQAASTGTRCLSERRIPPHMRLC